MRLASRYAVRLALVASLFGLWLFTGVGRSYACSCVEPDPPAEALANSTVVFAGRVVAIRGFDIPESGIVSSADLGTIELQGQHRMERPRTGDDVRHHRAQWGEAVGSPSPRAKNTSSTPGATPHHRRSASAAARVWPPMLRKTSTRWEKAVRRNPGP